MHVTEKIESMRAPATAEQQQMDGIAKTFDYLDEEFKLLYQACQLDSGERRYRRPDSNSPGKWILDLEGVRRVPYNEQLGANQLQP